MAVIYINTAIGARGGARPRVKLEGVRYRIELAWVAYSGLWVLSLLDGDGAALKSGLTLRHGVDVLAPFSGLDMPGAGLGQLGAWDTTGQQQDPGRRDLVTGAAVRLVYIEAGA